jgi:hypothetical protein
VTTPIFLGTGGGIFGAIRKRVSEDANLRDAFGNKIKAGRFRGTDWPYVVLTHSSAVIDDLFTDVADPTTGVGDRYDVWKETIQVSVYTDSYEASRLLGRLLHVRISRQTFLADCVAVTLFPDSRMLSIDPQQISSGADVWHYDYRYHFWTADKLLQDQYQGQ